MWLGKLTSSQTEFLRADDPDAKVKAEIQRAETLDKIKACHEYYVIAINYGKTDDGGLAADAEVIGQVRPDLADTVVFMTKAWAKQLRDGKP